MKIRHDFGDDRDGLGTWSGQILELLMHPSLRHHPSRWVVINGGDECNVPAHLGDRHPSDAEDVMFRETIPPPVRNGVAWVLFSDYYAERFLHVNRGKYPCPSLMIKLELSRAGGQPPSSIGSHRGLVGSLR